MPDFTAIFIISPVERRRKKLAEEIPVGGVDLNTVEPCVFCPFGSGTIGLDDLPDVLDRHFLARRFCKPRHI